MDIYHIYFFTLGMFRYFSIGKGMTLDNIQKSFIDSLSDFGTKWQKYLDLIAAFTEIPSALIVKNNADNLEIVLSSKASGNPYKLGDREDGDGMYSEAVIKSKTKLLVPNSLKSKKWKNNPDVKLGMISYLGYPLCLPDGSIYGTICIIDSEENQYSNSIEKLLLHFKEIIETDISQKYDFKLREELLHNKIEAKELEAFESRELASSILKNLQDAYIRADIYGTTTLVNEETVRMYGADSADEIIGRPILEFYDSVYDRVNVLEKLEEEGILKDFVCQFRDKRDNPYWVSMNVQYFFDSSGARLGTEAVVRDITERRQNYYELLAAKEKAEESNKLKNAFLNNISHEIRTPMNGIVGFAQLLENRDFSIAQKEEFLSIIKKNSLQMLGLLDDIIDVAQVQSGQIEINESPSDMNCFCQQMFYKIRKEADKKGIILKNCGEACKHNLLSLDYSIVTKIAKHLLDNALKFTETGEICFSCELIQDDTVKFSISDTGIGLDKSEVDSLFEDFRQAQSCLAREYEGLGLGLPISKGYVEAIGGTISAAPNKDKGATFSFTIPYKKVDLNMKPNPFGYKV
jgi:PAS domain S-box-containing protein